MHTVLLQIASGKIQHAVITSELNACLDACLDRIACSQDLQATDCHSDSVTESDATHPRQLTHANTQHRDLTMVDVQMYACL